MKLKINRQKDLHRDIYNFPITKDQWFQFALFVLGFSVVFDLIKGVFSNSILAVIVICGVVLGIMAIKTHVENKTSITPYGPKPQFIGLYSIEDKKIDLNIDNGLIPRDMEIGCLRSLIDKCFYDTEGKRGICLIGRSGSGKSTIVNQFEYDPELPYKVHNFSNNYDYFEDYILSLYRDNPEKYLIDDNRTVFILDHFERYFSLTDERKASVKNTIRRIAKLSVVFIFSMREEFFVPFLAEFDINDLDGSHPACIKGTGILSYKEYLLGNREKTEENVLICGSEKETNDDKGIVKTMARLCNQAFGDERGDEVYRYFQSGTLIQQQIIFNMLKHEFDEEGEIATLNTNIDENTMMKKYYDVQLCSTGDYYMASRIMYILCVGRNKGISFTDDDVKNALCVLGKKANDDFNSCLNKLHELKLIKFSARNTTARYEIAHDYVAKSYEAYANTELPSNVKNAMDEFISEYIRETNMSKIISDYRRMKKWISTGVFGWIVFIISLVITSICFTVETMGGSSRISWAVFIICITSILYVFSFYMNITRHYRKGCWVLVTFLYLLAMCFGTAASVFPEHWLYCLGAGNAAMGLSCCIIGLNFHLAEMGRKWFRAYGLRTFLVVFLLIALSYLVQFASFRSIGILDTKSILQLLPMVALLVYGFLSHLNKEYFYTGVEGIFSTSNKY